MKTPRRNMTCKLAVLLSAPSAVADLAGDISQPALSQAGAAYAASWRGEDLEEFHQHGQRQPRRTSRSWYPYCTESWQ